jgi:arylsulfatase A-like enzyme
MPVTAPRHFAVHQGAPGRRLRLGLTLTALLCLAATPRGWGAEGARQPARPNVLLIVMDTTRADHLSCYGYGKQTTPALDRIASQGVLFEQMIAAASWTLPSHATLFTGLYPRDHKATGATSSLPAELTTLAEVLAAAGYDTAGFSCNPWLTAATGLTQGFRTYLDVWRDSRPRRPGDDGTELAVKLLLDWVDSAATRRPFFAFVNFMEPHLSYDPPEGFEGFLPAGADPAQVAEVRGWQHPREVGYILRVPGYDVTPAQFRLLSGLYDGEIAYLDSKIGELFQGLEKRGVLKDTLLIVTSDHGEHLGDHALMDHKMSLYDALIRVPTIIRYPGVVPQGVRVKGQVQNNDIFPTVLRLCGLERTPPAGAAVLPFDDRQPTRELTFAEFGPPTEFLQILQRRFPGVPYAKFDRSLVSVRGSRYKYIWASDGRSELYDLERDSGETRNVAAALPKVAQELRDRVLAFRSRRAERPRSGR